MHAIRQRALWQQHRPCVDIRLPRSYQISVRRHEIGDLKSYREVHVWAVFDIHPLTLGVASFQSRLDAAKEYFGRWRIPFSVHTEQQDNGLYELLFELEEYVVILQRDSAVRGRYWAVATDTQSYSRRRLMKQREIEDMGEIEAEINSDSGDEIEEESSSLPPTLTVGTSAPTTAPLRSIAGTIGRRSDKYHLPCV
jgi:hypothetical protein